MSGAGHQVKQLWNREDEVEYLRNKEKQHRFAEVAEYCDDGECHSGKVAERVSDEYSRWIPTRG